MDRIEFKTLIGLRTLTAIETGYVQDNGESDWRDMQQCNYFSFTLDGIAYTAIESPEDGYRSCMDRLILGRPDGGDSVCKTEIPDTAVLVVFAKEDQNTDSETLLWFFAVENGKIVVEVGTDNSDNWYPQYVGCFRPENLPVNTQKPAKK
jgi:hypothetical protein